jgi:hypothetical protein
MIFDVDGQAFLAGNKTWAAGDRPAFKDSVHFETQIVVQPPGVMLLDDEAIALLASRLPLRLPGC